MLKIKFKTLIYIASGLLLIAATSCKKDFGGINQNPGNTTQPVTASLLTNVLSGLGNFTWDAGGISTAEGLYAQYFSETQYTDVSRYAKNNPDWSAYYTTNLFSLQTIINYNTDPKTAPLALANGSNNNQIAIARILKAYIYWFLTDAYGDVPYKDALNPTNNGAVAFDTQQSIYTDLFKELTEAVAQFDNGDAVRGDILFDGDISKWKKFANSIHALIALRLSKVDAATGKTEFNTALNNGVLEVGETISLAYPGGSYLNPVYNFYYGAAPRIDYAVSSTITDWLTNNNDRRINAYASSSVGFPYGLTRNDAVAFANANVDWAKLLAPAFSSATSPITLISSSELFLARAEAAQLGWTNEDVNANYLQGIQDSWQLWGVYTDEDFNSYTTQPTISLTGEGPVLEKIWAQQWIGHFPNGNQGFADWRRTGYPQLTPAPGQDVIPRRLSYPTTEYGYNPQNTSDAAGRYKVNGEIDSQFGKVWWDN